MNLDGDTFLKDDLQEITFFLKISDVKRGKNKTDVFLSSQIYWKCWYTYHIYICVCVLIIEKNKQELR